MLFFGLQKEKKTETTERERERKNWKTIKRVPRSHDEITHLTVRVSLKLLLWQRRRCWWRRRWSTNPAPCRKNSLFSGNFRVELTPLFRSRMLRKCYLSSGEGKKKPSTTLLIGGKYWRWRKKFAGGLSLWAYWTYMYAAVGIGIVVYGKNEKEKISLSLVQQNIFFSG